MLPSYGNSKKLISLPGSCVTFLFPKIIPKFPFMTILRWVKSHERADLIYISAVLESSERSPPLNVYHRSFEICEISLFLVGNSKHYISEPVLLALHKNRQGMSRQPYTFYQVPDAASSQQSPCSVLWLSSECWPQHGPICVSPWWCTLPVWKESRFFSGECWTRWRHMCPLINGYVFVQLLLFDLINY